jgi:uncharacterized membrane protein YccC
VELVVPKRAAIPWPLAVQAAVAVGGAFGGGVLTGHTAEGLLASLGCLPAVNSDRGGPYRLRLRRMLASGVAAVIGVVIGMEVRGSGQGWLVVATVGAVALVAGVVSSVDAVGSLFGLNLLVYVAIASSDPLPRPVWRTAGIALAGVAWGVAVTIPGFVARRTTPEREAVAAAYDAIADLLAGAHAADRYDRRWALTAALNQAEDGLVAARTRLGGPDRSSLQLLLALEEASGLSRVAVDRLAAGRPAAPASVLAVRTLAAAIRTGREAGLVEPPDADLLEPWAAARRVISGETTPGEAGPVDRPGRRWLAMAQRASGRRSLEATARLMVCMITAELLCVYVVHSRSYWVPLTVAVAMKPDFGSVFARAVQRALGTAVGVVVGGTILVVIGDTRELVPFLIVLAALLPVTIVRNYGMFVTVLTPLVLILIDSITPSPGQLVSARLLDTLLGCGIVLVLGYLVWPATWRPRLLSDLADAVGGVVAYLRAAARADDPALVRRRDAYRALSNLRTTMAQHFADPSPVGGQARILWPGIVALEQALDETVRLASERPRPASLTADLEAAADELEVIAQQAAAGLPAHAARRGQPASGSGAASVTSPVLADRIHEVAAAVEHLRQGSTGARPGNLVSLRALARR